MARPRGNKRKFSDIQMVLLVVGREKTEISVHENVLFEVSPVFKAAFSSRFREGYERSMYLPDDDAILMDILIQSLYAPESTLNEIDTTMQLSRLYVLADKYDIVKIKNMICKQILSSIHRRSPHTSLPGIPLVKFVYENTQSTAPMRRLLVDWFVWGVDLARFNNETSGGYLLSVPEFTVDVCFVLAKGFNEKARDHTWMKKKSVYLEEEPVGDKSQSNTQG